MKKSQPQTCSSRRVWHRASESHPDRNADRNDDAVSVSAHKGQRCHDAEAQQDEHHFEQLIPRGVELMWEDL